MQQPERSTAVRAREAMAVRAQAPLVPMPTAGRPSESVAQAEMVAWAVAARAAMVGQRRCLRPRVPPGTSLGRRKMREPQHGQAVTVAGAAAAMVQRAAAAEAAQAW